ncbi:hypothetical protein AAZX31_08G107000 [Glycine max]|uniref:Knottin scorpion toxin-like domain-containing protein n=2 Tax=Glycine subgen. Soja TaxID=1462606 RepID=K7L617_SOYBN|nr:hypothetical protein JHK86_021050 [Glycine max]KAH1050671.1 hypothetical protein GYH30_020897 [Glycine max]KRH42764.1 hypothetical protein GLYMA_08G109800v4 [Glycine max]RZB96318.1 hypothetical protein D0Y65_020211 [Glycine soja]
MSHSLVSVILVKVILAAMIIVLFSHAVRSQQICLASCKDTPSCDAHCKFIGYGKGTCFIVSPTYSKCCCF